MQLRFLCLDDTCSRHSLVIMKKKITLKPLMGMVIYMRVGSFMLDSLVGICLQEFFMGFLAAQSVLMAC